jgi:hypothetical protein
VESEVVVESQVVNEDVSVVKSVPEYSDLVSDAKLAEYREEFANLSAQTREGYDAVRKAIAVCRTTRTGIERKRKFLNEGAQTYIRTVNGEAKRLTEAIEAIEEPLKDKKQAADDERERLKAEAEEAKRNKIDERISRFVLEAGSPCSPRQAEVWTDAEFESELSLAREAFQVRMKAEQEAEEERKRAEAWKEEQIRKQREEIAKQQAEIEKIRAEHEAELQRVRAEQAERDRIDREKLEFEKAALKAENERLAKIESDRLEAIRKEQEASRKAEEERIAAERAEQRRIAEMKRLEALKPDLEKVDLFSKALLEAINSVPVPVVASNVIRDHFKSQVQQLVVIASSKPHVE